MGEDDYSWLINGLGDGSSSGGGGDTMPLLPLMPTPDNGSLYTPMTPFDPSSPQYGNFAINADGSPVATIPMGGGGGSNIISQLAKFLGFGQNNSGLGNLWPILSLLGIGAGAYLNHSASRDAAKQMSDAINSANDKVTGILGNASTLYRPYADLGTSAVAKLQAMPASNIAAQFRPLGTGRGIVSAPNMTLGQLAGR